MVILARATVWEPLTGDYTNILKCQETVAVHGLVQLNYYRLTKEACSYFSLKNQIFFLDIFLFTTHELFKAHFPEGVLTFRTPQHAVSEGPAMVAPKEKKMR